MQSRHRSGRPPRLTRRNAIRQSAYVPRPEGLTRFSPPTEQTNAPGSSRADDSDLEEGDVLGATEEVGEVEETGAGTALSEASASSVSPVAKRRIANWRKLELVGAGSFSRLYKAVSEDGLVFAVKEASLIGPENNAKQSASQLEQEILLLSQLEHKNIVQYFGAKKVGDIKCAKILLDQNGTVKVGDFGLAKQIKVWKQKRSCAGSVYWMAPEVIRETPYGRSADIWSLGCPVLEMFIQRPPYPNENWVSVFYQIGRGQLPPVPSSLPLVAREVIHECLRVNPDDRPSADELLRHPFVALPDPEQHET